MSKLGERLKIARDNSKLSQLDAAKKLGISNGTLSGYERNYRDPDTAILNKMAELYDVSTDWLMGRTDEMQPHSSKSNEDEEFQKFINDPELERWYKELPKSNEEDLRRLRKLWEIIKNEDNDN